ncbi:hypothetical protein LguiB_008295 [Lonicera macranthoides]
MAAQGLGLEIRELRLGIPGAEALEDADSYEYVPIYEDRDVYGDWMLFSDVSWEMFIESCKRLRIMKRLDAKAKHNNEAEAEAGEALVDAFETKRVKRGNLFITAKAS